MSEEWKVQLSVKNTRGDLLNIRGAHVKEIDGMVDEARNLRAFGGFFNAGVGPTTILESTVGEVQTNTVTPEQAQELVTKHLGPDQVEPASQAQVQYLVNLGVSAGEARTLSKKDASARIKALKESK